jgi:CO/xanthine dehydrogenase Mo-binding subunit
MTRDHIGRSLRRLEDERFLTGQGRYVDDIAVPGQLYSVVLRSPHGHAVIEGIDAGAARAMPGVHGVFTAADIDADGIGALPCVARVATVAPMIVPPRRALAQDRVRHVGDPVAFVVAGTAHRRAMPPSGQGVHSLRQQLAGAVFNMPPDHITVRAPDVGGGFGVKNFLYPEWILVLWAARRLGRPVKWVAERGEEFVSSAQGRDNHTRARLALDRNGRFLALDVDTVANLGAYLSTNGPGSSTLRHGMPCRSACGGTLTDAARCLTLPGATGPFRPLKRK